MKSRKNEEIFMRYSAIVLLEENSDGFSEFLETLYEIFSIMEDPFEILVMANGTEHFLKNELQNIQNCNEKLKAFVLDQKTTQAGCLKAALKESCGKIIMVCGSYQQITKDSFIRLLSSLDKDTDIISPWRQQRVDPSFNRFQSSLFNVLVRKVIGSKLHDLNCTVKIFRREVLEETELYGNMYRFMPIIADKKGFRSKEVKCDHYQERGKTGFYGISEYFTRLIDILTLYFNTKFTRKPLRFFSSIGVAFMSAGLLFAFYVLIQKIFMSIPVGDNSMLLLAILFVTIGVQVAGVGLLGEIISFTHGRIKKDYTIEKMLDGKLYQDSQESILEK